MTRIACGITINRNVWPVLKPNAFAASVWPLLTARIPERTFSAIKAAVYNVSANQTASISGMIMIAVALSNPCLRIGPVSMNVGWLHSMGIPTLTTIIKHAAANMPAVIRHIAKGWPVINCFERDFARMYSADIAAISKMIPAKPAPLCHMGKGRNNPSRLTLTAPGIRSTLPRLSGKERKTVKYQKNNCRSSGIFRKSSIYTVAKLLKMMLFDSRIIPTRKPITVAAMIPRTATRSVFIIPIRYTSQ